MGRWQVWPWIVLFAAAPPFWAGLRWAGRRKRSASTGGSGAVTVVMLASSVLAAVWAIVMWIDPQTAWWPVSFEVAGLGGRFVGPWLGFPGGDGGLVRGSGLTNVFCAQWF